MSFTSKPAVPKPTAKVHALTAVNNVRASYTHCKNQPLYWRAVLTTARPPTLSPGSPVISFCTTIFKESRVHGHALQDTLCALRLTTELVYSHETIVKYRDYSARVGGSKEEKGSKQRSKGLEKSVIDQKRRRSPWALRSPMLCLGGL